MVNSAGIRASGAYRLPLTAHHLMNRSLLGEMFQEGLANLALDVFRFFLGIYGTRGRQQNLFDFFSVCPTEVHEAQDHTPLIFNNAALALNHRAINSNRLAGLGILHLK
jgi:hypothetical protein